MGSTSTSLKYRKTLSIIALAMAVNMMSGLNLHAADKGNNYMLRGIGANTCTVYLDVLASEDPVQLRPYLSWIEGYISAVNRYQPETYDATPIVSIAVTAAIVNGMCEQFPDQRVERALVLLINFFKRYRVKEASQLIEVTIGDNTAVVRQATLRWMQEELAKRGHYSGPIDGAFTTPTRKSIGAFQKANDLPPTMIPDEVTVMELITLDRTE